MDMRAEPVRVAALMLRSPAGRILMMRRVDDGTWAFPAGHAEGDEAPDQTAARETFEETGYKVTGAIRRLMQRIKDGVDAVTFVTDCPQEFAPTLNDEHDAWMWVEPMAMLGEAASVDPQSEQDAKVRSKRRTKRPRADAVEFAPDAFDEAEPRDQQGKWTGNGAGFKEPTKTIKAYKQFEKKGENLYPLFIGSKTPTEQGKWIEAHFIPTKSYAERPGWHAGVLPIAPHLRTKKNKIRDSRVWAEVELPADKDYQAEAEQGSTRDIRGRVPEGGYYRFKTNKMQGGAWLIGGAVKINRVLGDEDVSQILRKAGHTSEEIAGEMHGAARADDFDESEARDPGGKWTGGGGAGAAQPSIRGLPEGMTLKDRQVDAAMKRGAHDLSVSETPGRKPSWDGKKPMTLKIGAKGGTPYTPRTGRPGKTASYDPKLSHLVTVDKGEPYLERTYPVPNDEASARITPLSDPDVIYRGMSAEEYEGLKAKGVTQSQGDYNIGAEQQGLSYWTTDPEMANSYANSFAPWEQKPTFERPAYILAMKRPRPEETSHVEGTGEAEVGVNRPVQKSEIVGAWRGNVYDHEDGEYDLTQNTYEDKPEYRTGGGTAPSARVAWSQLASPFEETHADALTDEHERTILDALRGLEDCLTRVERRHDGRADDFNPSEPREPSGGEGGGRWTAGGGGGGGGAGQAQGAGGAGADPVERAGGGRTEPAPGGHGAGNLGGSGPSGLRRVQRSELSAAQPDKFHAALRAAKASNPHSASVAIYTPAEYAGMKTFTTSDGKAGVAVKADGDIVSLFKAADGPKGFADTALQMAVENGGKKLDCFDTVLPSLYAKNGFKVVARLKFNPDFAPEDWDNKQFSRYNNGQPDVVFMTYDPEHASSQGGQPVNSYEEATALQDQEIASRGEIVAQGADAAAEIGRQWKQASPATDVDQLIQLANGHQNELATLSVKVAQQIGNGVEVKNPGVKSRQSLIEKTTIRGKKVGDITDAVRLGFDLTGTPEAADQVVQQLASGDHLKVADEGWRKLKGSGYFDRTVKVRFADGVVGEIQMWPPGMFKAKMDGHGLYEQSRVLPEDDPRQAALQQQMTAMYDEVAKNLPEEWRRVVE